jgi:tRNA1Val (adenine37-N6)-methyltransferase
VHQQQTAMKVCTDACLFGAWLAQDENILEATSLLDIGTGTGLLSLMVAQAKSKNGIEEKISITALEIEAGAAIEATRNVHLSPWSKLIEVLNTSLQEYTSSKLLKGDEIKSNSIELFDCIFSNPPFYEGDLQSPNSNKNLAAHSTALPWVTLVENVANLLNLEGYYYILIPAIRAYTMQKLAKHKGLELVEEVVVYNASNQKPFRVIQKFQKTNHPILKVLRSNFFIKDINQSYTNEFVVLLKDYYLHLK